MAGQGAVLVFIIIVAVYSAVMKRLDPESSLPSQVGETDA